VTDIPHQSPTVIVVRADETTQAQLHERAAHHNVVLGVGYGTLQSSTFRLGNFPAITAEDIDTLENVLRA